MTLPATPPQVVCFGEVLWDLLPDAAHPGGAPMNVAYHLHRQGLQPALLTRVGRDEKGEALRAHLSGQGIDTGHFQTDDRHATGLVYAQMGAQHEVRYDIVWPSAWDFIGWEERFTPLLAGAEFFVFGSLSSRGPVSRETLYRLLEAAPRKVLDINLRPPHFTQPHIEYLLGRADILKLNLSELELVTDWLGRFGKKEERMQALQERFNIPTLIVTMGGEGALARHEGRVYRHPGFPVQVADTIGSGDAFLAGFLCQFRKGAPVEAALAYACGLGALVASYAGACPAYDPAEVQRLMHRRQDAAGSNKG